MKKEKIRQKILKCTISGCLIVGLTLGFSFTQNNKVQASTDPITMTRLAGQDRYETATKISQYFSQSGYYVILVNSKDYPDSVTVAPLAKKFEAPILLVDKDNIPDVIKNELVRLKTKKVFIIGGTSIISKNVENQLSSLGIDIEERIFGADRYETSTKIAYHLAGIKNYVYVTEDEDWRNALSVAPVASWNECPVILVGKNGVSNSVKKNICNEFHNYFLIGENSNQRFVNNAINGLTSNGLAIKSLGNTKEDTNIEIYNSFKDDLSLEKVYLVNSNDIPDALTLGYLAGLQRSMILFVNPNNLTPTENFLYDKASQIKEVVTVGGEGVMPQSYINGLYDKMMEYKTRQDSIDLSKQNEKNRDDEVVIPPDTTDSNYEKETRKVTLLQATQFICKYLKISQDKIGLEDYLVEDKDNITIENNANLIGHMCTFFNLSETELNYTYIIDRNTGNLYEKIDMNNKDSKKYKFLKNILNQ